MGFVNRESQWHLDPRVEQRTETRDQAIMGLTSMAFASNLLFS